MKKNQKIKMPKTFLFLDEQKLIIGSIEVLLNYAKKKQKLILS